ncbi:MULTISPECIES: hypothetical protein [Acidianus]|uniref:Uncharacterized protein n=1 Tax=Candidatus Acidianus copahuensis TaxID=1160895 RepID=A0A031LKD5_9CREN|nr:MULTISPECIES: hypothetical protein [Acidianus]EZQ03803.1 hypothetical protein CM19_08750 [Candidatus Acidianus copahuensis]NON61443.1 hypothetical protein [Acidianus sp. RZ1]
MDDVRDFILNFLRKRNPTLKEDSLDIKFIQQGKNRYDVFGQFRDENGIFEFAISFDFKGKIEREHINMIEPSKLRDELEKRLRE